MFYTEAVTEASANSEAFPFWEAMVALSTVALVIATGILIIVTMKVTQTEEHKHQERSKAEEDMHKIRQEAEVNRHAERMAEIDKATDIATVKGIKILTDAIREAHNLEANMVPREDF